MGETSHADDFAAAAPMSELRIKMAWNGSATRIALISDEVIRGQVVLEPADHFLVTMWTDCPLMTRVADIAEVNKLQARLACDCECRQ